jgi:hypothetical protein
MHQALPLSSHRDISPHYVIPYPSGCDCDYYAAMGETDPTNSACVLVCNAKPTTTNSDQYGWVPAAQTNMAVEGEKGYAKVWSGQSFRASVSLSVSVGDSISGGAGYGQGTESTVTKTSPTQTYKGGLPTEAACTTGILPFFGTPTQPS